MRHIAHLWLPLNRTQTLFTAFVPQLICFTGKHLSRMAEASLKQSTRRELLLFRWHHHGRGWCVYNERGIGYEAIHETISSKVLLFSWVTLGYYQERVLFEIHFKFDDGFARGCALSGCSKGVFLGTIPYVLKIIRLLCGHGIVERFYDTLLSSYWRL